MSGPFGDHSNSPVLSAGIPAGTAATASSSNANTLTPTLSPRERESSTPVSSSAWRAVIALAWREIVRFFRQRNRIIGSIGTPLVFWLLFGAGLARSFRLDAGAAGGGPSFLEYFFPGSLLLIVLFTAIFSSISIIED